MIHNDITNDLASIANDPVPFTLDESLQRADFKTKSRARVLRILVGLLLVSVVASVSWYFTADHSDPLGVEPHSVSSSGNINQHAVAPAVSEPTIPTSPLVKQQRQTKMVRGLQHQQSIVDIAPFATPDVIKSLDLDPKAYSEIAAMLGTSDRVIMVENTANRESCIQISCSGGESHTITCSLPAPLPFRVTQLDGTLLYDIERPAGNQHTDALIPIRVQLHDADVLLWYDAEPKLKRTLGKRDASSNSALNDHVSTTLRSDHSSVFQMENTSTGQLSIEIRSLNGLRLSAANVEWQRVDRAHVEVSISGMHRGVYELVTTDRNQRVERSLLMVK